MLNFTANIKCKESKATCKRTQHCWMLHVVCRLLTRSNLNGMNLLSNGNSGTYDLAPGAYKSHT